MADVQSTGITNPPPANAIPGEPIGKVNVYDTTTGLHPSEDKPATYATQSTPVTRSSPGLMTWLMILVLVILAIYLVVQFLT